MDVSQLEQELACNDDHSSQQRELMEKIRGTEFKAADKLRLALLYALRYEDTADISSLKRELLDAGVSQQKVQLIDAILRHGGKVRVRKYFRRHTCGAAAHRSVLLNLLLPQNKRAPGLYGDRSFMSRMAKNLHTGLTGVENVGCGCLEAV